jgi:hypothetical protein
MTKCAVDAANEQREEIVRNLALLPLFLLIALGMPAQSEQADPVTVLTNELKAHAPDKWELRVRWRDGQLLASVTPWPYQQAFDLWYDAPRLMEALASLCPGPSEEIWKLIGAEEDVILEPTVGGKSAVEARVNCRKVN